MLNNFKDLLVWQKSYQLCLSIYKTTINFPTDEKYGLVSQLRRAAVSVPSNISEGYGKKTIPDYVRSLYMAYGSICEIETQILLSNDLGFIRNASLKNLHDGIKEIERMLKALINSLEKKYSKP